MLLVIVTIVDMISGFIFLFYGYLEKTELQMWIGTILLIIFMLSIFYMCMVSTPILFALGSAISISLVVFSYFHHGEKEIIVPCFVLIGVVEAVALSVGAVQYVKSVS